jgi:hypothetical protein
MITADQLVAHAIGDYVLQSDWMANKKRSENVAALWHAFVYALCFLPFAFHPYPQRTGAVAWLTIFGTHFLIDRFGLARYVVWAKNFLAPRWIRVDTTIEGFEYVHAIDQQGAEIASTRYLRNLPWSWCVDTGYPGNRPPFLAVWLLIIADNILHVVINALALRFL